MCRSRRELSNESLLAKFGFDTAENEPCKVCPLSTYRSPRCKNKFVLTMSAVEFYLGSMFDLMGNKDEVCILVERFDIEPYSDISAK